MSNTVILKWNPAISSYTMSDFLTDIIFKNTKSDWSIWEYERVHRGDVFYMLKVGREQNGLVMSGKITSEPKPGEDWSKQGRKVFYSKYKAEIMINPDTFAIPTSEMLQADIPDFDWFAGHSGMVLDEKQSELLDNLWKKYLQENKTEFRTRLDLIGERDMMNDQLYLAPALQKKLFR